MPPRLMIARDDDSPDPAGEQENEVVFMKEVISMDRNGDRASAKTEPTPAPTTRGKAALARTPLQPLPVNAVATQQQKSGLSNKTEVRRVSVLA
eukprot:5543281-Pleurochrysis_carterae.AAC.1